MSNSDVFWVGGVKSKGGNDGIGDKGGDNSWDGGKLWGWGCHESHLILLNYWLPGIDYS